MSNKLNIPTVAGNIEGLPYGATVFLQAVHDALNVLDNNVVYKDNITTNIPAPRLRALSAQGQTFSVQGTNLASGDDYNVSIRDQKSILEDLNDLRSQVTALTNQIKGK